MNFSLNQNSSTAALSRKVMKTLMSRSGITFSLMSAAVLTVSGCATTPSLTPQQCQSSNWQEVGYSDGIRGRSGNYFGNYANSCASVGGTMPNRMKWEEGRQQGLKNYCTELNAYKLGREGYDWQSVCPLAGIEALEEAYSQGRYYYIRQRDLDYLGLPLLLWIRTF